MCSQAGGWALGLGLTQVVPCCVGGEVTLKMADEAGRYEVLKAGNAAQALCFLR